MSHVFVERNTSVSKALADTARCQKDTGLEFSAACLLEILTLLRNIHVTLDNIDRK